MGQVSVTLNGRTYRLECGEGEEAHLIALSEYLASHMEIDEAQIRPGRRRPADPDGVFDGDRRAVGGEASASGDEGETMAELRRDRSSADESVESRCSADLADTISAAADRLEQLSQRFARPGFDTAIVSQPDHRL